MKVWPAREKMILDSDVPAGVPVGSVFQVARTIGLYYNLETIRDSGRFHSILKNGNLFVALGSVEFDSARVTGTLAATQVLTKMGVMWVGTWFLHDRCLQLL